MVHQALEDGWSSKQMMGITQYCQKHPGSHSDSYDKETWRCPLWDQECLWIVHCQRYQLRYWHEAQNLQIQTQSTFVKSLKKWTLLPEQWSLTRHSRTSITFNTQIFLTSSSISFLRGIRYLIQLSGLRFFLAAYIFHIPKSGCNPRGMNRHCNYHLLPLLIWCIWWGLGQTALRHGSVLSTLWGEDNWTMPLNHAIYLRG